METRNWYKCCGDSIRAEFGADSELFIDLLAATSPRKQVAANWRLAMRIYHVWKNAPIGSSLSPIDNFKITENLFKGTLPAHRPNVLRALKREPLSGNKVRAFAANLKGNMDEVTIDVWVCRYFGWDEKKSMSDRLYYTRAERIKEQARAVNMKPAEYQAVIWCKVIRAAGKKPQSYLSVKHRHQMYFEFFMEV